MSAMISAIVRKPRTNRTHGRVKTKNEMSRPKCGSFLPNDTLLRHSRNACHCPAAPVPASRPSTTGMPMVAIRRSGSIASRYWSRFCCCGVTGA